ncbi:tRNA nucleotidyltransferase (CCA-adding enzyme) [Mesocricetibacter intestinalis]|uniref:Multifunctional CCA protein n=1 Tax=Mesocricetibacter intestinalis TaxID=1521930 RepID=A0A4R6V7N9_9PAST|nr:multifunctional CCA addition/repair protein [Mesocricetibacter intestinalis]TDQ57031.1 tRNA nucleotidyltransferase (CCA-adding enzyme) [Mesocricetibacter intestinalis]
MKVYLVGGAVRDRLLNLKVQDRDWVVVGATQQQLIEQGYLQVGKDFPVFLHPQTKEEYALARTEVKSGSGYTGFICDFSPHISLEQDLCRRDLSINAIAQDQQGNLHDPYRGVADLNARILRHISPAFAEDPLRVLRVARFAARYHALGFKIAPETLSLMTEISLSGELGHLSAERIWLETEKALAEKDPQIYFEVLHQVGALAELFPEIENLHQVPNPAKYHPEVDSFIHTMLVLKQAALLSEGEDVHKNALRFAALCHDLGKALTPQAILPHHYGHEKAGLVPIKNLCQRLKVPVYYRELALLCCEYHSHVHKALELRPGTILKLFNQLDIWRRPRRFQELMLVCLADNRGRTGFEQSPYPQQAFLQELQLAAAAVDVKAVIAEGFEKQAIREELNRRRLAALSKKLAEIRPLFIQNQSPPSLY